MYPNPVSDVICIKTISSDMISSVRIIDALGREVLHSKANSSNVQIDLSTLSQGMYEVYVLTESGIGTKLLIKE
jgi:hypothetical protein